MDPKNYSDQLTYVNTLIKEYQTQKSIIESQKANVEKGTRITPELIDYLRGYCSNKYNTNYREGLKLMEIGLLLQNFRLYELGKDFVEYRADQMSLR